MTSRDLTALSAQTNYSAFDNYLAV